MARSRVGGEMVWACHRGGRASYCGVLEGTRGVRGPGVPLRPRLQPAWVVEGGLQGACV